ncbi:MAG: hypothetical protein M3R47_13160 [Chloroflexota bacterium]|nr:hypothetical protein [Chloroflexota bacterium]
MIFERDFKAQIDALSSYLNFSDDNWKKFEQTKDDEIKKKIDVLRQTFVNYQQLSDNDVSSKVFEREALVYDVWDARDNGIEIDDFHLESEEYDLLFSYELRSEFLKNKSFFYFSFVIMTYSFIERHLSEICFHIHTQNGVSFDDKHLKGKGVQRASTFLEKTLDYQIDRLAWEELMLIRRLRNNLVHMGFDISIHQGDDIEKLYINGISKFDQDLVEYLTKRNVFRFPSIMLNIEYCQHLVEFTKEFFEKLINDLGVKDENLFL